MADGEKFGGNWRRELKEEKNYINTKIMLIIIIDITSIEGDSQMSLFLVECLPALRSN